jgi:hypothetical protein
MLRTLRCRYAQGFLIARPMPSDRLAEVYAIGETTDLDEFEDALLDERTPVRYTSTGADVAR